MTAPLTLETQVEQALDAPFSFDPAPTSVPPEMRPAWRVTVLLHIVSRCRGRKASWKQLHLLNWAIRNQRARDGLLAVTEGRLGPDRVVVRFDPALAPAIDLAVGSNLVQWETPRLLALTDAGHAVVEALDDTDLFADERDFLAALGPSITQKLAEDVLGREW